MSNSLPPGHADYERAKASGDIAEAARLERAILAQRIADGKYVYQSPPKPQPRLVRGPAYDSHTEYAVAFGTHKTLGKRNYT